MPRTVGIAGFGTIGRKVANALDDGIHGLELVGVCGRDRAKTESDVAKLKKPVPVLSPTELAQAAEIIVECVPKAAFLGIVEPALNAGCLIITVSGAGLLEHPEVIERAARKGAQIILATGALLGLDAVRAAAEGEIHDITMVTRKPPLSLAGAPYLEENNIDVRALSEPLKVFSGSAREGAAGFPANVNVAAALGLAGVGADQTKLEIWADPTVTRNTHSIRVESAEVRFEMKIENVPTVENPATGKLTALSVIACLRALTAPLRVGS
ncbi:MAG: aspartate dehydrogenase [Proteobacteria bacterium]|nr:aspartate dehydrogenase [Pseudomonadota bacterium]